MEINQLGLFHGRWQANSGRSPARCELGSTASPVMSLRRCASGRLGNALPLSKVVKFLDYFYPQKSLT
uniref:Uncharacterized protein n=1 Tax=Anguilla anguilla TaxID=7936 RepID=A0A0E9PLN7_ANGAN